jgi:hypothetical protein
MRAHAAPRMHGIHTHAPPQLEVSQHLPPGHADHAEAEPADKRKDEADLEHVADGGVLAAAEDRALA